MRRLLPERISRPPAGRVLRLAASLTAVLGVVCSLRGAAPAVILSMEYQPNPQPPYLVPAEALLWKSDHELQVRIDYEPREDGWWVVVDFGPVQVAPLNAMAPGRLVERGNLPSNDSPRLELLLADAGLRAVLDPRRPGVLVLLNPSHYRQAWQLARSEESWEKGLQVLEEVNRLGAEALGLPPAEVRQAGLGFLRRLGRQAMEAGDYRRAAEFLSRARTLEPEFESDLLLARAYLSIGQVEMSRQLLGQLRQISPTRPEVFYYLGLGHLKQQEYGQTILRLEQAARADEINNSAPALDPKLYCFLGTSYYERYQQQEEGPQRPRSDLETARSYLKRFLDSGRAEGQDRQVAAQALQKVEDSLRKTAPDAAQPAPADAAGRAPETTTPAADRPDMRSAIRMNLPFEHLQSLRGKVVLVHFWATWCSPCLQELPALSEFFAKEYPGLRKQGLELVTVSNDHRSKDFLEYARGQNFKFPIFFDPFMNVQQRFGLAQDLPRTLVLGPDGQPLDQIEGPAQWGSRAFKERLQGYMKRTNNDRPASKR